MNRIRPNAIKILAVLVMAAAAYFICMTFVVYAIVMNAFGHPSIIGLPFWLICFFLPAVTAAFVARMIAGPERSLRTTALTLVLILTISNVVQQRERYMQEVEQTAVRQDTHEHVFVRREETILLTLYCYYGLEAHQKCLTLSRIRFGVELGRQDTPRTRAFFLPADIDLSVRSVIEKAYSLTIEGWDEAGAVYLLKYRESADKREGQVFQVDTRSGKFREIGALPADLRWP